MIPETPLDPLNERLTVWFSLMVQMKKLTGEMGGSHLVVRNQ